MLPHSPWHRLESYLVVTLHVSPLAQTSGSADVTLHLVHMHIILNL